MCVSLITIILLTTLNQSDSACEWILAKTVPVPDGENIVKSLFHSSPKAYGVCI